MHSSGTARRTATRSPKSASLPSSKVYSTLERLASKGIVHTVLSGGSTQYVCVLPQELLPRLRQDFVEPLEFLEKTLPSLASFEPASEVLTVSGLDAILESSRSILRNARQRALPVRLGRRHLAP